MSSPKFARVRALYRLYAIALPFSSISCISFLKASLDSTCARGSNVAPLCRDHPNRSKIIVACFFPWTKVTGESISGGIPEAEKRPKDLGIGTSRKTEKKKREKQRKAQISRTHADHRFSRLDGISAVGHISGPIRESRMYIPQRNCRRNRRTMRPHDAGKERSQRRVGCHHGASTLVRSAFKASRSVASAFCAARIARKAYCLITSQYHHDAQKRGAEERTEERRRYSLQQRRQRERERERNANGEHKYIYIYIYIYIYVRSTRTHTHGRVSARYSIAIRLRYDAYAREGVQYALRCIMRYMRAICTRAFAR